MKFKPKPWPEVQELLGPLSTDRREALRKSIDDYGYKGPPVYCLPDGRIIDGHNRWEIAPRKCRVEILDVDEATGRALAFAHNTARRQLNNQQLKVIREAQRKTALKLRQSGQTQAAAAAAVGVSQQAVSEWEDAIPNTTSCNTSTAAPTDTCESNDAPTLPQIQDVRVKLTAKQKQEIVWLAAKGMSQSQIAADFGVSQKTISTILSTARKKQEQEKKLLEQAAKIDMPKGVIVGDFRDFADRVPDGSLDLIFTDPPYDRASVGLYGDLAQFGARKLREGGSLLAYCGQYLLPEILGSMGLHLRYWWTVALTHSGPQSQMREYGIKVGWKPLVWYVRSTRGDKTQFVCDLVKGAGKEKSAHDWQQGLPEAVELIKALCPKGGFVCDPFLGGGTTVVAAKQLGLHWFAFEISEATANKTKVRLAA